MLDSPAAHPLTWIDPEHLFRVGVAGAEHGFWLDAGPAATTGWSWLGVGMPRHPYPMIFRSPAKAPLPSVPGGFAGGWVGYLSYDGAARTAGAPASEEDRMPERAAIRVRRLVAFEHASRRAWVIAQTADLPEARAQVAGWVARGTDTGQDELGPPRTFRAATARDSPEEYARLIEQCRGAIRAGDAYQLCLTTRFEVATTTEPVDPVSTYLRLRRDSPAHHGGYLRIGAHALLSASPEEFLHVASGVARTRPIKGTRPRGADPASDEALAAELRESGKERAENIMIVDLMRNDLQRVCVAGSVAAERLLEIESFPAVHQLVSTIAGRLEPATTLGALLAATFPAGSMTGAPKLSAMTILHALEKAPRGPYAGCFGWVGEDGSAGLAMTIRTIAVYPGGAYVGAGGGITWLSRADDEVAEVAVKARGPLAALGASLPTGWCAAMAGEPVR